MLEKQLSDAPALLGVLDEERHLGRARVVPFVAAQRDHPLLERDHERHPLHVVDVGEPLHVALGQLGHGGEEPEVLGLVGDAVVELDEQVTVVDPDRPDVGGVPVAEQDVGLPVPRGGMLLDLLRDGG